MTYKIIDILNKLKNKYTNIDFKINTNKIIEFHLYNNNVEIANGIETISGCLYVTLYDCEFLYSIHSIIHGYYGFQTSYVVIESKLFKFNNKLELFNLQKYLIERIEGSSEYIKKRIELKDKIDKIFKIINLFDDNNKKEIYIKKIFSIEQDFETC